MHRQDRLPRGECYRAGRCALPLGDSLLSHRNEFGAGPFLLMRPQPCNDLANSIRLTEMDQKDSKALVI